MSQQEPTKAYVYQPGSNGSNGGAIFAVSGPGTERFRDERFTTRTDAQDVADSINRGVTTSAMLIAFGRTPKAQAAVRRNGGR